ncbi:hypothetical protein CAEBREN_04445 [Caenorhabditis brenneri]|uniref:Uncharacterized protein n=1 Tax=Caenorhabditis brenneri TaxID=135651 RepID=G0N4P6_CAEBE|nr:hypothetical protein CAEBREN_04445 [Caenorhabditis brenneri]
MVFTIAAKKI